MINYEIKTQDNETKIFKGEDELKYEKSSYNPTKEERGVIGMIRDDYSDSYVAMYKPRYEFNDLALITRIQRDQRSWNTYQPNDGDYYEDDISDSWQSNAVRPVIRNKCVSVAAHTTARLIFPKVFAYNEQSEEQKDAAQVMRDLIEWSSDQSNYPQTALFATISALVNPVSLAYTEYSEVYKRIKTEKVNGEWQYEEVLDEEKSGFKDVIVAPDQLYIGNFYEYDIQNQPYLIWRRVLNYETIKQKYADNENLKYIKPGVQVFYDDANDHFYDIYDEELRDRMCEEVLYWNKDKDVFLKIVNGVLMCEYDNPNPRKDKLYPFAKFGYELIDEGKFFYYKSLSFKLKQDADILSDLYSIFVDGAKLDALPPSINAGPDDLDRSVFIPGSVTSVSEDNKVTPLIAGRNIMSVFNAIQEVEGSINESSEHEISGQTGGSPTAYEMALREKERQTKLGLFVQMLSQFVNQYNKLRIGDILQYMTIAQVDKIIDNAPLVYKTFLLPEKQSGGREKTRKIDFDGEMKDMMTKDEKMKESYKLLEEGGEDTEICKVNPVLFRNLKYLVKVTPDVMNPISEELERAYGLEEYDRAIQNPYIDQEKITRDLLLGGYPKTKSNPDEYMKEPEGDMMNILGKQGDVVAPSEKAIKQQPPVQVGV